MTYRSFTKNGPLIRLPDHNDPAGSIVSVCRLPEPVQVGEIVRELRPPPAQRHDG